MKHYPQSLKTFIMRFFSLFILLSAVFTSSNMFAAQIDKALLYDKYTLQDTYPYKNGTRQFQWDKINNYLTLIDSVQSTPSTWGILQNYKNFNGQAPLVKNHKQNAYKRVADTYGVERYQGVPLYSATDLNSATDLTTPERYGQDGDLVQILSIENDFVKVKSISLNSEWLVPKRYVNIINQAMPEKNADLTPAENMVNYAAPLVSNTIFNRIVFVDRTNQNITTLEKVNDKWLVRSMNPTTTGAHKPPYQMETPLGIFVVQEKKRKMYYYVDGTTRIAGYAPYASRFSTGAYLHGVPLAYPQTKEREYSSTLGTIPRSHKCVRNATSHALFLYDWARVDESLVIVIE